MLRQGDVLNGRPKRRKSRSARARKRWSLEELNLLQITADSGKAIPKIRIPGRSRGGVNVKAYVLGIGRRMYRPWSEEEDNLLREQRPYAKCAAEISIENRTTGAVRRRLSELRLAFSRAEPWTATEDLAIRAQLNRGIARSKLEVPNRSSRAAQARARKIRPQNNRWTPTELKRLESLVYDGKVLEDMKVGPHSTGAIQWKLRQLDLPYYTRASIALEKARWSKVRKRQRSTPRWTADEKRELRKQAKEYKAGTRKQIQIPGRGRLGINYMLRELKISLTLWTKNEVRKLRSAFHRKVPTDQICIPGKSQHAIEAKAARLGLLKPKRKVRRWTIKERTKLYVLIEKGLTASAIIRRGYFKDRPKDSINQAVRRRRRQLEATAVVDSPKSPM